MLLLTCPFGLTSLLTKELKRLGIRPHESFPTGCRVEADDRDTIITINLQSRIANKVFLQLTTGRVRSFEELFQLTQSVDRKSRIPEQAPFHVLATTQDSILHAPRSIQSIVHKAIVTQLTGSADAHRTANQSQQHDIYVYIDQNQAHILQNTSGDSLHKRGWREEQGPAPIKENLAIATLLLASRPFHQPLRDPCCGSGTLVIEAARLARNIASGEERSFLFEQFPDFPKDSFEKLLHQAQDAEIDKKRTIVGSDNDPHVLEKARKNAVAAGVDDIVTFVEHDLLAAELPNPLQNTPVTVIANPPYDRRLQGTTVGELHHRLAKLILQPGRNGAIISGYEDAEQYFPSKQWKRKETRQGKEKCYIWVKKGR